ncbi:BPSL0761 family protein [Variovorax sp. J22R133]|uniref:BPSL0761 family protein n=1 Tax=Variovorax brevis TaxID=3053503 RepID=UPI0025757EA3|nr:BPSL0761 family protein [Variovorax sp. J22R133]MDM0116224.1 BPSL0761 family protein [Variovorax sp. J22R133]
MTLPHERLRALESAYEFLMHVAHGTPGDRARFDGLVPRRMVDHARAILRHYPSPAEMRVAVVSSEMKNWLALTRRDAMEAVAAARLTEDAPAFEKLIDDTSDGKADDNI